MKARWLLLLAALPLAGCEEIFGSDDGDNGDRVVGAVYTMNNAAASNYVIVFARRLDGALVRTDSVATDGQGSGPHPVFGTDPLESQDALILHESNRLLFAVSAGSNEVTSFVVGAGGRLTRASTVSSGGQFPVSLSSRANVLYVVNAMGGGNISGFLINPDGTLVPLPNSTRPLSGAAMVGPGSIRISPNGTTIVVTEKPTNRLVVYALGANGLPSTERTIITSPGPTPFGADFDARGHYILSIGNIGPNRAAVPDGSSVASMTFAGVTPTVVGGLVPTTETAACWVQITEDGRFAYITNTGSGSISGFRIAVNGTLTPVTPDGKTASTGAMSQPLDMAFADAYLYALTSGDRGIRGFRAASDGSLTPVPGAEMSGVFPVSVTGLAAY